MNLKKPILLILGIILVLFVSLFGCSKSDQQKPTKSTDLPEDIKKLKNEFTEQELQKSVAMVNGSPFTISDLLDRFSESGKSSRQYIKDDPKKIKNFLEKEIVQDLLYEKAKEKGYENNPSVENQIRISTERGMMDVLREREIESKIEISENEIKDYYEENLEDRYTRKARVKLNKIVVPTKEKAEEVLSRVNKGEDFLKLANEYSIDNIYYFWLRAGMNKYKDIEDEAFALSKPGEVTDPINTDEGYTILQFIEKKDEKVMPFEEVKDKVREEIFRNKTNELKQKKLDEWKNDVVVKIDEALLKGDDLRNKDPQKVLVEMDNHEDITLAQFINTYHPPGDRDGFDARIKYLDRILERPIMIAMAKKKGYDKADKTKQMVERDKRRRMVQEFYQDEIINQVEVSDEEVREFYDNSDVEVRARHILVDSLKTAKDLLERIKNGENFKKLVKKYSQDTGTVPRGGDLGFFRWGTMVDSFQEAAFELDKNEVSDIVKTQYGYHIIQVLDKRDAKQKSFDKMERGIRNQIKSMKISKTTETYLKQLKKDAQFTINMDGIELFTSKIKEMKEENNQNANIG